MPFPDPSTTLLAQAGADTADGHLRLWMQALPETIRHYLSRWRIDWTGESLGQGYLGYVLPCRCRDGTAAILKLTLELRNLPHRDRSRAARRSGPGRITPVRDRRPRLLKRSLSRHPSSNLKHISLCGASLVGYRALDGFTGYSYGVEDAATRS
jgi:hypothetical protein